MVDAKEGSAPTEGNSLHDRRSRGTCRERLFLIPPAQKPGNQYHQERSGHEECDHHGGSNEESGQLAWIGLV